MQNSFENYFEIFKIVFQNSFSKIVFGKNHVKQSNPHFIIVHVWSLRNPFLLFVRILCLLINSSRRLYIRRSRIFEKQGRIDRDRPVVIERQFVSFMNMDYFSKF